MTNTGKRGPSFVEIRLVIDPAGRNAVLLQLEHGFVVLLPADARRVADAINEAALEAERD